MFGFTVRTDPSLMPTSMPPTCGVWATRVSHLIVPRGAVWNTRYGVVASSAAAGAVPPATPVADGVASRPTNTLIRLDVAVTHVGAFVPFDFSGTTGWNWPVFAPVTAVGPTAANTGICGA